MQVTMRIERYADQGRCVAHLDGRVVFVRFALPGELVEVRMDEPMRAKASFWTGEVVRVIEASPDRVEPAWKLAGPLADGGGVGGADLIHVSLPGQLRWKASVIANQFQRLAHMDIAADDVEVVRIDGDEALNGLHWRTRIDMVADDLGRTSMRKRESHERIAIDTMPLATRAVLAVANSLDLWNRKFEPNAQIRLAVPEPRVDDVQLCSDADLLEAIGNNYALLVNGELVSGSALLREQVRVKDPLQANGLRTYTYEVDANGFWQIHRLAPEHLVDYVLSCVRTALDGRVKNVVLWDLYSGSGLFTLPLATMFGADVRVLSVEGSPVAVRQAHRNIGRLGLSKKRVEALQGDVAKTLAHSVDGALAHPDVVVLDPPRAGAKAQVCKQIAAFGARHVVYVACDPTSLARDTGTLLGLGYRLVSLRAFDIYANTHHTESVAEFAKID